MDKKKYNYDAFISHSVADKIPVADQLYIQLKQAGLKIWYSGNELTPGDSISKTIQEGLAQSRYGIVILSPSYLSKLWPLHEFYILWNRENEGKKVILPVLHDVTPEDLSLKSLDMADRWSTKTSKGLDAVTEDLVKAIRKDQEKQSRVKRMRRSLWFFGVLLIFGLLSFGYYLSVKDNIPPAALIEQTINSYVDAVAQMNYEKHTLLSNQYSGRLATSSEIIKLYLQYGNESSYYRNLYSFEYDNQKIQFKKNVNALLGMEVEDLSPANNYSLDDPTIRLWYDSLIDGTREIRYSYLSKDTIRYTIENMKKETNRYIVTARFLSGVQYIEIMLRFPNGPKDTKIHEMRISGVPQQEEFVFVKEGDWRYSPKP